MAKQVLVQLNTRVPSNLKRELKKEAADQGLKLESYVKLILLDRKEPNG